jgi:hypothetical protein
MEGLLKPRFSKERGFLLKCWGIKGVRAAVSCIKKTAPVKRLAHAFCFTLLISLLSGCGGGDGDDLSGCVCTMEVAMVTLSVVDRSGNPVIDANIAVTIKRTQELLAISQPNLSGIVGHEGLYVVFTDSFRNKITTDPAGETLTVTGNSQGRIFSVEIVVTTDLPCRCHVQKVSGPSSVTL